MHVVYLNSCYNPGDWRITVKWNVPPLHILYFYFFPFVPPAFRYLRSYSFLSRKRYVNSSEGDRFNEYEREWATWPFTGCSVSSVFFANFSSQPPLFKLWYNDHYMQPTVVLTFCVTFSYWFIWQRCIRFEFRTWNFYSSSFHVGHYAFDDLFIVWDGQLKSAIPVIRQNCAYVYQLFVYSRFLPHYHQHVRYTFQTKPIVVRHVPQNKTVLSIPPVRSEILDCRFLHIYN